MKRLNGLGSLSDLAINRDFDTVRSRRGILLYGEEDEEDEERVAPEQRAAPWQRSGKEGLSQLLKSFVWHKSTKLLFQELSRTVDSLSLLNSIQAEFNKSEQMTRSPAPSLFLRGCERHTVPASLLRLQVCASLSRNSIS